MKRTSVTRKMALILAAIVLMTASGDASRSESGLPLKVTLPLDPDLIPDRSIILYTHADADHLGPGTALALAKKNITMVGTLRIFERLVRLGVPHENIQILRIHEHMDISGVQIHSVPADHPWQLKDLERGGPPYRMGMLWLSYRCTGGSSLLSGRYAPDGISSFSLRY